MLFLSYCSPMKTKEFDSLARYQPEPNNRVQATPGCACLSILSQEPGVPYPERWAGSHARMKSLTNPVLIALLLISNGCTSTAMVSRAKGYTCEPVQPLKGDTLFLRGGRSYVVQQRPPERHNVEEMPPAVLQPFPPPYYAFRPCVGCYASLIVTVPFDAVT